MDSFGLDDLRHSEAADILRAWSDDEWATDRELVDHRLRDPWASEAQ
jgi:hypothetical protein